MKNIKKVKKLTELQKAKKLIEEMKSEYIRLEREYSAEKEKYPTLASKIKSVYSILVDAESNYNFRMNSDGPSTPEQYLHSIAKEFKKMQVSYAREDEGTALQAEHIVTLRDLLRASIHDPTLMKELEMREKIVGVVEDHRYNKR